MKKPAPRISAAKPARRSQPLPKTVTRKRGSSNRRPAASMSNQLLLTAVCVLLLAAALPTALLLAFALLPAFCALITDRSEGRSAMICVGSLNVAGTWPYLLSLWTKGHTVVNAMQIIFDPYAWLVIYSAAAVGWMLYMSFPSLVSAGMALFAGHRLAQLRQQRKQLIADWGTEVSGASKPS